MLIGDGGVSAGLLKLNFPEAKFTLINLGKVSFFENLFLQTRFPICRFYLAKDHIDHEADFNFVIAEKIDQVTFDDNYFDLAINVASMQEMTNEWIERYFILIRRTLVTNSFFYCCNRREKSLPGGETVRFLEYPWRAADLVILDEEPKFYRWFCSLEPTRRNVLVLGRKVPCFRLFDGPIHHRLVRMTK